MKQTMEKEILEKRKSHAFCKDVYLLGEYDNKLTWSDDELTWDRCENDEVKLDDILKM